MLTAALRNELINSLSATVTQRRCVLCGTEVASYLDELPCPHWFLTSGRRAFSERHLRSVFKLYDVAVVIEYLRVVCIFDRVGRRDFTATDLSWSLSWRDRRWVFEKLADCAAGFTLSVFNQERHAGCWHIEEAAADLRPV